MESTYIADTSKEDAELSPLPHPGEPASSSSFSSRIGVILQSCITVPLAIVGGLSALILFSVVTLTGIGPLVEYCQSQGDQREHLDVDQLLHDHPEMMLLEIPAGINRASMGQPYRVMVRITRPPSPSASSSSPSSSSLQLPPVIMPGGLASNLMTMAKIQDQLTQQHGFTVVNFDRLGVGWSDPYPMPTTTKDNPRRLSPSAADVAREMKYVMDHCGVVNNNNNNNNTKQQQQQQQQWIQIGGSMGSNVAAAFVALYPNDLIGFFNLDGLPHAFLQIQCKKFLVDGAKIMSIMRHLRWTGLPRLALTMAMKPMLPAIGSAFTARQVVGVMCREQFFVTTGLEYTTLMSCCDLEVAAWGPQATTEYKVSTMRQMTCLAPTESIIVDEMNGIPRQVTQERAACELGTKFTNRTDHGFLAFFTEFRQLALTSPDQVDKNKTHCNWPMPNPRHPVGDFVGGVDSDTMIHPLATSFGRMVVRVMCARCYKGFERDYTQPARNHAAARTSLHVLMSANGKAYYYPRLTHLNLWQQSQEVVDITYEMAQCIQEMKGV
jgi:pimeloyl-ACP methyl ester carboxylesterase